MRYDYSNVPFKGDMWSSGHLIEVVMSFDTETREIVFYPKFKSGHDGKYQPVSLDDEFLTCSFIADKGKSFFVSKCGTKKIVF